MYLGEFIVSVEKLYISAKSLLGVRDTILIESGILPLKEVVRKRSAVHGIGD